MKLVLNLPSQPGWLFFTPGLDLFALLLALVTLTSALQREEHLRIELPVSSFQGEMLEGKNPVLVHVSEVAGSPHWRVGGREVPFSDLVTTLTESARQRETELGVVRADRRLPAALQQQTIEAVLQAGLRCYLAVEPPNEASRARPAP